VLADKNVPKGISDFIFALPAKIKPMPTKAPETKANNKAIKIYGQLISRYIAKK